MPDTTDRDLAVQFIWNANPADREKLITDDFVWWTSYHHGPMTFEEYRAMTLELAMPVTFEREILGVAGERDRVAIEIQGRCTLPDGRHYDNNYCFVVVLREGRVCEVREYCDTLLAAQTFDRYDIAGFTRAIAERVQKQKAEGETQP